MSDNPVSSIGSDDTKFQAFFAEHLEEYLESYPVWASHQGDHRFDHLIEDVSRSAREDRTKKTRDTLARLNTEINVELLSRDCQIDFEIFHHDLEYSIWADENTRAFEEDPRTYNDYLSGSVYALLAQSTLPAETNISNAISRIKLMPEVVAAARENLERPPRPVLETSITQNLGVISFFESGMFAFVDRESPQYGDLKSAADRLLPLLKEHHEFLEGELRSRTVEDWRLGKAKFSHKLEFELHGSATADELLADAEREFDRVESDMYVIARQLWSARFPNHPLPPDDDDGRHLTISKVLDGIGTEHGKPEDLADDARATVKQITEFIGNADILCLPDPDRCQIIEMPEFHRGNSLAYLNAAPPLDAETPTYYAISPPPADWSAERVESFLQEYNRHMLQILTIHEAYPGHYVQLEYSNRSPSLVRRILKSGVMIEGWAVYTEQMMLDQGYGDGDLALRLTQLKFYLRAVANAILDHKMHCTEMTDDEAMKLLTRRAFQSDGEAHLKVVRAKQSSVQLSTYFAGRMAVYRMRQEIQRELGDRFDLGRFHEALLDHGSVPVGYLPDLVRRRMEQPR